MGGSSLGRSNAIRFTVMTKQSCKSLCHLTNAVGVTVSDDQQVLHIRGPIRKTVDFWVSFSTRHVLMLWEFLRIGPLNGKMCYLLLPSSATHWNIFWSNMIFDRTALFVSDKVHVVFFFLCNSPAVKGTTMTCWGKHYGQLQLVDVTKLLGSWLPETSTVSC